MQLVLHCYQYGHGLIMTHFDRAWAQNWAQLVDRSDLTQSDIN
jgi:hypothetical protein